MRILLDTCSFIWAVSSPHKFPRKIRQILEDEEHLIFLSAVSIAEVGIKSASGKILLPLPPKNWIHLAMEQSEFQSLPFDHSSALLLSDLPPIHKDPFDRMLVCQALAHDLVILTPDLHISKYPVQVEWWWRWVRE